MTNTPSTMLQTMPLGYQWPTVDPFLFCIHHLDHYPAGNAQLGPVASLDGRPLGDDFDPVDGWRMYHGHTVPGFPAHPHRGFETVTFVRTGMVDHSDSLGAAARYGNGDVQWMTAGRGIVHSEMFPLLDRDGPNPLELFQIWVNLPARSKMVEPHFSMLWDGDLPREVGDGSVVTVIAGRLGDSVPPSPPPASWGASDDADVAIWHIVLEPGATCRLPAARFDDSVRTLYVFAGDGLTIDRTEIGGATGAVVDARHEIELSASGHVEILMLQGRPIGEPVQQHGPFVMNTGAEIGQAFDDYQRTRFGGWPWDRDDPVHGAAPDRFVRRDGMPVEEPPLR